MKLYKQINNQEGASAVEFAIVLPLFITLTFGIIEFGLIMYNKAAITNASREGARFGILFDTDTHDKAAIIKRVEDYLKKDDKSMLINLGGEPTTPDVDARWEVDGVEYLTLPASPRGGALIVSVTYPYDFLIVPNFIPAIPKQLTLQGITTMRME